jgi:DNA invertase Pin-like site-specific DNA recombinase
VGYIRTSREDQDLSPDAQIGALRRWCHDNKGELLATFQEDVSGGAPLDRRPQLLAALDSLVQQNAGTLLVLRRDRLARDNIAAAMIDRLAERNGARVLTTDGVGNGDGPEAQLMRGIVDLFAQYERALIKARTKAALAVKRARGERLGGAVPYGYRSGDDGCSLRPNPSEQDVIEMVVQLRKSGLTLQAITDWLNKSGAPCRGSRWHLTTVARVLRRAHPQPDSKASAVEASHG